MYTLIPLQTLIKILGAITLIVLIVNYLIHPPTELLDYMSMGLRTLSIAAGLLWLIGGTPIWRYIWKWFPKLNLWIFPDINGKWSGETRSNWSIIKKMLDCSKQQENVYNPQSSEIEEHPELTTSPMVIVIKMNWFKIDMVMQTDSDYSKSTTWGMKLLRPDPTGPDYRLLYTYHNITTNPKTTDTHTHHGTGLLNIELLGCNSTKLSGNYWTDRQWNVGFNTAGNINLERVSD